MPVYFLVIFVLITPFTSLAGSAEECGQEALPCLKYGARVFVERCSLCHGSDGLGEGILSMSVKDYPNTNLLENRHGKDIETIRKIVIRGSAIGDVNPEMPPWGDELTVTQLESVVAFNHLLLNDLEQALALLKQANATLEPSLRSGRAIFLGRCSLCHGKFGQGNGKMSRIIKDPPPYNLTLSRMPDDYLSALIHNGGAAMGRSPRMPPFGNDLSDNDIQSVIMFIKTLRTTD